MQSFTQKEIDALLKLDSAGQLTPELVYRRAALRQLQNEDNYVTSAIKHLAVGAIAVFFGGVGAAPIFGALLAYNWYRTYEKRTSARRKISSGDFLDYLNEDDRTEYMELLKPVAPKEEKPAIAPTATEKPIEEVKPVVEQVASAETKPADVEPVDSKTALSLPEVAIVPAIEQATITPYNIAKAIGEKLKPTIITAMPRVGKGIIISHAWRYAKQAHPGLTVWLIQPKPHPSESGYWHGCDRYWGKMIENYPVDDELIAEELTNMAMEWRNQANRPTLLIIDELVKLEAMQPKWFKSFIPSLMKVESSSGETDSRFLWAITQSPLVKDLGLSGGNRSAFELVAIEKADTQSHVESICRSYPSIPRPATRKYEESQIGSMAYWSKVGYWAPVPLYEVPTPVVAEQLIEQIKEQAIALDKTPEPEPQQPELDEIAMKLLSWLEGTGQKYASEDGLIYGPTIVAKFRYKVDGKACALTRDQVKKHVGSLQSAKLVELSRSKDGVGIRTVKLSVN